MDLNELREFNRLVLEASKEVVRPWKWTTFILSVLLFFMIFLYFIFPSEISFDANLNENSIIEQNNG